MYDTNTSLDKITNSIIMEGCYNQRQFVCDIQVSTNIYLCHVYY